MGTRGAVRQRSKGAGFTLVELMVTVAILAIVTMLAVPNLRAALGRSRRNAMVADAKTLFSAMTAYNAAKGEYPPCCTPATEALDKATLFPLPDQGYLKNGRAITQKLRNGMLTTYDSPDNPTANHDFYAVMTAGKDPRLQVVVADTDEYPGFAGVELYGVYVVSGSQLVPATDMKP